MEEVEYIIVTVFNYFCLSSHQNILMLNPDHESVDYISNLPDAVLYEILSYLPTRAAARTSVLSKRWRYSWMQVPALDLTDVPAGPQPDSFFSSMSKKQIIRVVNFVSTVLLMNKASYLTRFCLHFDFALNAISVIELWLDAVKWREIREVSIELCSREFVPLPREFLCGSNLVAINLNGFRIPDMKPSSFHLPNLETVHFGLCTAFPGDRFLNCFVSSCPVLKELFIHSTVGFDETVWIESSSLKSLEIRNIELRHGKFLFIRITAPNLRYFGLEDGPALYEISDLYMLTEADLCLKGYRCRMKTDECTFQLLKRVSGVRTLQLRTSSVLQYQGKLPTFENLIHLRVHSDQLASEILKYAPKLTSSVFEKVGKISLPFDPEDAHECMSCLERVEFFLDEDSVLNFIEHFLRGATALKEMVFNLRGCFSRGRGEAVHKRLTTLPMSSPNCQIKFVFLG